MHSWFFAVYLAVVALLLVASQQTCLPPSKTPAENTGKRIRISKGSWSSAELNAQIVGILLREKLGYEVELIKYEQDEVSALAKKQYDVVLELWKSLFPTDFLKYVTQEKQIEDLGALGVVGQVGWYVPLSTLSKGEYDVFSTFQDASKAQLFAKTPNATKGYLHAASDAWSSYDAMIVKNLGLELELHPLSGEEEMMNVIDDAVANNKPVLTYAWTPHPLFSKHQGKLVRVALPFTTEPCQTEDRVHAKSVNCDYPAEMLLKAVRLGFKEYAPDVYQVIKRVVITNADQIELTAAVAFNGVTPFDAACTWVKANEERWKTWFIQDSSTGNNNSLAVSISVPIAVVVPCLAATTCIIITVICLIRQRKQRGF